MENFNRIELLAMAQTYDLFNRLDTKHNLYDKLRVMPTDKSLVEATKELQTLVRQWRLDNVAPMYGDFDITPLNDDGQHGKRLTHFTNIPVQHLPGQPPQYDALVSASPQAFEIDVVEEGDNGEEPTTVLVLSIAIGADNSKSYMQLHSVPPELKRMVSDVLWTVSFTYKAHVRAIASQEAKGDLHGYAMIADNMKSYAVFMQDRH